MANARQAAVLAALPMAAATLNLRRQQAARPPEANPYLNDPVGWITDVLGEHLWSKQRMIAESVSLHRKTVVPSGHEVGKSWLAARIVVWWIATRPIGEAFVVTTAPTAKQVEAVLWREIHRAFRRGALPGRLNIAEWYIGDELVAFGRKPSDTDPTAFQGIHARHPLVVIDEGCGVPQAIWTAANSLVANENGRMFAIGNPDDSASYFAEVCRPGSGWNVIEISAFDSPNFTGEEIPAGLSELLVSPIYEQEMRAEFGADSSTYLSKVCGSFSSQVEGALIPISYLIGARDREPKASPQTSLSVGIDYAGPGEAETVMVVRRGGDILSVQAWPDPDPRQKVIAALRDLVPDSGGARGLQYVSIDSAGLGWYPALDIKAALEPYGVEVRGINVGTASRVLYPNGDKRFKNLKAELYWDLRQRLATNEVTGLTDDRTLDQLADIRYTQPKGVVEIEKKEDAIKRGRKSPDRAEATMLAFAPPTSEDALVKAFADQEYQPEAQNPFTKAWPEWRETYEQERHDHDRDEGGDDFHGGILGGYR